MIKLLWRTDIHLSDKTPVSRLDNWRDTVMGKIKAIGEKAKEHDVMAVLDGGDFFDIKSPNRNSHSLVREVIEVHKDYPCPVYANVGNHDCVYGDYKFLPQQPLGVLFSSGCFNRLYDDHEVVFEKDGLKVRVVGIPYHGVSYDMDRFKNIKKGDEDYLVVIAHVLASPKGGSMFEGEDIIKYDDLKNLDPDLWCFGHWHKDQGIVEIADGKWVVNIGSLTRGSLTQDNLDRQPCYGLLEFSEQGISLSKIPIEIQSAEDIFDVEKKMKEQVRENTMTTFVTSLKDSLAANNRKDLKSTLTDLDIPKSVRERALLYLEQVS